jgi:transcription elongation factor Elf1
VNECPCCYSEDVRWMSPRESGIDQHAQCRSCGVVYRIDMVDGSNELDYLEELIGNSPNYYT